MESSRLLFGPDELHAAETLYLFNYNIGVSVYWDVTVTPAGFTRALGRLPGALRGKRPSRKRVGRWSNRMQG